MKMKSGKCVDLYKDSIRPYDLNMIINYYETNYDLLVGQTSNDVNIKPLGNINQRICRFCGKTIPTTTFNKEAHVFPVCTGNKYLLSFYECDKCNKFFGDRLESEYQNFFSFVHNIYLVSGRRNKIPIIQSNDNKSKNQVIDGLDGSSKIHLINDIEGEEHTKIDKENGIITIESPEITVIPIAVYKCLVKMALTIMPDKEMEQFKDTLDWVKSKKHIPFFEKKHICRYVEFDNSPRVNYPMGFLLKRKEKSKNGPYMIFIYVYARMVLMIEVPTNKKKYLYDLRKVPMFFVMGSIIKNQSIDLSECNKVVIKKEQRSYQALNFQELTDEVKDESSQHPYAQLIREKLS